MVVTKMQQRLLTSPSKVILAANGRGVGHTTGFILRAILEEKTANVVFYQPHYRTLTSLMDKTVEILKSLEIDYTLNRSCKLIKLPTGKSISFRLPESEEECESNLWWRKRIGNTLVILDQVDMFDQYFVDYQIEMQKRNNNTLMFSAQPYSCGWRDIKIHEGYPVIGENGLPDITNASWDYELIDWKSAHLTTRVKPENYNKNVEVITGYGVNSFLEEENPTYIDFMNRLPPKDLYRLDGEWKGGVELVTPFKAFKF